MGPAHGPGSGKPAVESATASPAAARVRRRDRQKANEDQSDRIKKCVPHATALLTWEIIKSAEKVQLIRRRNEQREILPGGANHAV